MHALCLHGTVASTGRIAYKKLLGSTATRYVHVVGFSAGIYEFVPDICIQLALLLAKSRHCLGKIS